MQFVSFKDNLHEMSTLIFWEKKRENIFSLLSTEFAHSVISVILLVVMKVTIVR